MKCCICGKETKYGNNPCGSLGQDGKEVVWGPNDRCCDECNQTYVVPGRLALLMKRPEVFKTVEKVPNK